MEIAAFVIGCLGFLIAALALGWQIASWALDGRRVKVTLKHGAMGRGGSVVGPVLRSGDPRDLSSVRAEGFLGMEVLGITVANVGRMPVTVRRYSVHAVGAGFAFTPMGEAIGPDLPYRLEPGDSETWYAEMQSARALLSSIRSIGRQASRVYMTVELGTGEERRTPTSLRVSGVAK